MQKLLKLGLLSALVLMAIVISCTNKKADLVKKNVAIADSLCDTAAVSYTKDIAPIITTYCMFSACHDSHGTISDYASLKLYVTNGTLTLYINSTDPNFVMPKPSTTGPKVLNACDFGKLNAWINAGGPQ